MVYKCSQQLQLLALLLEMLGYILGLLKGFGYLHKTGDLIGDNLTCRYCEEYKYEMCYVDQQMKPKTNLEVFFTVGNKVRKL